YTVNNLNQYTDINTITPAYDLNGNMVSKGPAAFDYDSENRLIEAITGGATSSYTSGPMGRRQSKTVNTDTTTYFYDGGNVIMEYDHAGAMAKRFVYGPMVDEPVCMITPSARYYYHADALGSVVALSDASGSISETYAYSPFGKTNDSRTFGNPYLFTGRRIDSESGLYYYRARHYDPQEGRFMQPDPIGFDGGINLYTYVQNNPVNWIDPSGLDTYRQNRVLGFLDSKGTATTAPATHTFIYTTNSDGSLNHTYSWGNVYDDQKRGLWRKDRPEDVRAANQAIQNKNVRGEKIGDASLDPYIEKVFTEWRDDPNHSSRHKWKLFNNCKTEATNLTNEASSQKAKAGK
ncbi:MAG: RHS repeat-associated core domain-containing protein, partial [Desulfobacterales bacterium]|nr:RHS repeat-associated core domain-containing protein [Desulfobacterales bacterium]